jgi:hypothetical protein
MAGYFGTGHKPYWPLEVVQYCIVGRGSLVQVVV